MMIHRFLNRSISAYREIAGLARGNASRGCPDRPLLRDSGKVRNREKPPRGDLSKASQSA